MKGFIKKAALGSCLGAAVLTQAGCGLYNEVVDPCWPERYSHQARLSVREAFNNQAANGHVLDQTVWNQHFEPGTAKLIKPGEDHLIYLARRRPAPDPRVFVQTAHDARGDVKQLNDLRVQVVQEYLAAVATSRNMPASFDVTVHDVPEPGLRARPAPSLYVLPASALTQPGTTVGAGPPGTSQSGYPATQAPGTTQVQSAQPPAGAPPR